ncbi:zinc finger domain-containing protein [Streptomyces rimosus]
MTPQQAADRTCPRCRAQPGAPCRNADGKALGGAHAARFAAARAQAKRAGVSGSGSPEPVPIERVRAVPAPARRETERRARDALELAARGLRAVPAHKAASRATSRKTGARSRRGPRSVSMSAVIGVPCPRCGAPTGRSCAASDVRGRPAQHEERTARARQAQMAARERGPGAKKPAKPRSGPKLSKQERRARTQQQQRSATAGEEQRRNRETTGVRRRRPTLADVDRAYREALGVGQGDQLPRMLGTVSSAGAARGGRGASRKGKGQFS